MTATRHPEDRVRTTSTTEGTGDITLATVAETGYLPPQDVYTDGDVTWWFIGMGSQFEIFEGTINGNTVTRDEVLLNSNGGTARINFGPGTKEVWSAAPGSKLVFAELENIFPVLQTFEAGIALGTSGSVSLTSGSATTASLAASTVSLDLSDKKVRVVSSDNSSAAGPRFEVFRTKAAPGDNSTGPVFALSGTDQGNVARDFVTITSRWLDSDTGAPTSAVEFNAMIDGVSLAHLELLGGTGVVIDQYQFLVGKRVAGQLSAAGFEVYQNGGTYITVDNNACVSLNRLNGDGYLLACYDDGVIRGGISKSGTTLTYTPFCGAHPSASPFGTTLPSDTPFGTVMVTADQRYRMKHLSCAVISTRREDPGVYGVFHGWVKEPDQDGAEPGDFHVAGVGTPTGVLCVGPVRKDDLLVTSDVPGHAEAWRWSLRRFWRLSPDPRTVLGKVTLSDSSKGKRLVNAVIYAG